MSYPSVKPEDGSSRLLANAEKTPSQKAKSDVINSVKKLTKEGKHIDAQALFREQFGKV